MNKSSIAVAAIALALTACAGRVGPDGFVSALVTTPDPKSPNVFITEAEGIVVDQEPIRIGKVGGEYVTIVWALPTSSPYYFKPGDIKFAPPEPEIKEGKCSNTEKTYTCTIRLVKDMHKYDLRANKRAPAGGADTVLRALDPYIMGN